MQLSYIHRRIVVTIRTHSEPQYCFIKLWADVVCLSITQNDDVIDMLLKENEKNTEKKGNKRGRKIFVYARNNLFEHNTKYSAQELDTR